MDLAKHQDFFDPNDLKGEVHIIGVGATGSNLVETLTRIGFPELDIYDFDTVSPHNVANQCFFADQVGADKVNAMANNATSINKNIIIHEHTQGWKSGMPLSGYVFLCVDNIDLRRQIVEENRYNLNIKAMFDIRLGLTDAQHYAADWSKQESIEELLKTMQFTHEEAQKNMPVSACGGSMSIIPVIRMVVSLMINNFINFTKGKPLQKMILVDGFQFIVDAFK